MEVVIEAEDFLDFDRSSCTFDYLQSGAWQAAKAAKET